jgi:hypothetical protein
LTQIDSIWLNEAAGPLGVAKAVAPVGEDQEAVADKVAVEWVAEADPVADKAAVEWAVADKVAVVWAVAVDPVADKVAVVWAVAVDPVADKVAVEWAVVVDPVAEAPWAVAEARVDQEKWSPGPQVPPVKSPGISPNPRKVKSDRSWS